MPAENRQRPDRFRHSVGVVENTLTEIALVYDMECEMVALPNVIMIKLGQAPRKGGFRRATLDHPAAGSDV